MSFRSVGYKKKIALSLIIFITFFGIYRIINSKSLFKNNNLQFLLKCNDHRLEMETLQYGKYWLLKNYIRGRLSIQMKCAESITYTSHGDYTYLGNLPKVVERWLAPISFAIFAPGHDFNATMVSIQYVRNCLPESKLIRDYVTFHIYFPNDHMPVSIAKTEKSALDWPYTCEVIDEPYAYVDSLDMYRMQENLTYPINVGRNIARKAANTHFIFACDIELYPSLGLVDLFLKMILKNGTAILKGDNPKVFPIPVFEKDEHALYPTSKDDLNDMLNTTMLLPFHYDICANCHLVPKYSEWIATKSSKDLRVFTVSKRLGEFAYWEPFYISDNREPPFDERVTWEGKSNKRIQNYAMCLLDYEYHVLFPPFLIHAPIIPVNISLAEAELSMAYRTEMNERIRYTIMPEYWSLYGYNAMCQV